MITFLPVRSRSSFLARNVLLALAPAMVLGMGAPAAVGCRNRTTPEAPSSRPAAAGPVVVVRGAGGRELSVRVELARTPEEHARGLMYRNRLDPDAGMLFLFPRAAPRTFWMKNVYIPLDMIFIGSDLRIVGIVEEAAPETETPRSVAGASQFVLEIGGGLSRRLGVTPGSRVEFRGVTFD
jgi:uncharacterized membrane protein (UPF0127 family)